MIKRKKVTWDNIDGCWVCNSHYKDGDGYPVVSIKGKTKRLGRVIYRLYREQIGEGEVIRHTCDNPSCINPSHLLKGTPQDNINDMVMRMRHPRGEERKMAVLTNEQASEIYKCRGKTQRQLATEYDVDQRVVFDIKHHNSWTHITQDLERGETLGRARGERSGRVTLSNREVEEIYLNQTHSTRKLAKIYNTNHSTVWAIKAGRSWKHITESLSA